MMETPGGIRGRPAGKLTIRRRQVLDYALRQEATGEPIILGKLIRTLGLNHRSDAKRILADLKKMGLLN